MKILELTDSLRVSREAVVIPLIAEGEGSIALLPDNKLRIVVAKNRPFEEWLRDLRTQLTSIDLSKIRQ
jgi:hypothetical protein